MAELKTGTGKVFVSKGTTLIGDFGDKLSPGGAGGQAINWSPYAGTAGTEADSINTEQDNVTVAGIDISPFIREAVLAERERCVKIAEEYMKMQVPTLVWEIPNIAKRIREGK